MLGTKQQALEYITSLKDEDIVEVTKKQEKTIRSKAQNDYWHGVICVYVGDFMGENNIAAHNALKVLCGIETTTNLSTDEFSFICNMVIDIFKDTHGVKIPLPNETEDFQNLVKYLF